MGTPSRASQNFFVFQVQRCNDHRFFKLKILFCFNSPTLEHLTSFTPNMPYTILSPNWSMFTTFKGIQMFVVLQKQRNTVQGYDLLWVLKCSLTSLSTIKWKHPKTLLIWLGNVSANEINVPLYLSILKIEGFKFQHRSLFVAKQVQYRPYITWQLCSCILTIVGLKHNGDPIMMMNSLSL
jgi:hypothetical protein